MGEDEAPDVFQDTMHRFSLGDVQARFFDCLHLDGTDLIDAPLTDRLDALERVAGGGACRRSSPTTQRRPKRSRGRGVGRRVTKA